MKTLIVVRHAKSSWSESGIDDFDRPLNKRGKKDAPIMAKRLWKKGIRIDLFLSSPAQRAHTTAQLFANEFEFSKKDIIVEEALYHASLENFYAVVASLSNKQETVAVFSHNPGITDFVNTLSQVYIENMPTCSVYAVRAETDTWASFKEVTKNFLFFDYPKNPLDS